MRACLAIAFAALVPLAPALDAQGAPRGKAVYDKWCAGCHGDTGAGDGPAADRMLPRPRDFRRAVYQVRTTASGELPTDGDLRHVIAKGMPGTAMPEWSSVLSEREIDDVIAYLKTFSTFFEGAKPAPIALGDAPRMNDEAVASGRQVFRKLECWKCHGQEGTSRPRRLPRTTRSRRWRRRRI
jgi:mono/diheme cytochrome c family protein